MHKRQKGKQTHSQTVEVADAPKWAGFSQLREKKLRQEISQREGPSWGGQGTDRERSRVTRLLRVRMVTVIQSSQGPTVKTVGGVSILASAWQ